MPTDPPIPAELIDEPPVAPDALAHYLDRIKHGYGDLFDQVAAGKVEPDQVDPGVDVEVAERLVEVHRWRPADDGAAEWLARLHAAAAAEEQAIRDQAAIWRDQINRWESERTAEPRRTQGWATALLEDYALRERQAGGRATIALPSARLGTRELNKGGKVVIADEDAVAEWAADTLDAAAYEEVVKTTTKVLLAPLRKRLKVAEVEVRDADGNQIVDEVDGEKVPRTELAAIDPDTGERVPGTAVEASYYSPSVTPLS